MTIALNCEEIPKQFNRLTIKQFLIIFKISLHKTKNISIFDYSIMPIGILIIYGQN